MVGQLETERVRQEVVAQQRQAELQALKEQVAKLQEKLSIEASSNTAVVDQQSQGDTQSIGSTTPQRGRKTNFLIYLSTKYGIDIQQIR